MRYVGQKKKRFGIRRVEYVLTFSGLWQLVSGQFESQLETGRFHGAGFAHDVALLTISVDCRGEWIS